MFYRYYNLERNPKAVFMVVEPGETVTDWKGARVYLEPVDMETSGAFFDEIKYGIAMAAGQAATDMIHAAIRFKITEVRPIVDRS